MMPLGMSHTEIFSQRRCIEDAAKIAAGEIFIPVLAGIDYWRLLFPPFL
jgi:hypothetical protein